MNLNEFVSDYKKREDVSKQIDLICKDKNLESIKKREGNKFFKKYLKEILLIVLSAILLLPLCIYSFIKINATHKLIFIVLAFGSGFLLLALLFVSIVNVLSHREVKGKGKYTTSLVNKVVNIIYSDKAQYIPKGGIDVVSLVHLNCFKVNTLSQDTFISGFYKGVECKMCNVYSHHRESNSEITRGRKSVEEIDFDGSVCFVRNNKAIKGRIVISTHPFVFGNLKFENEQFNSLFKVKSDIKEEAYYIITPQFQEALIDIAKSYTLKPFTIVISEDTFAIVFYKDKIRVNNLNLKKDIRSNIEKVLDEIVPLAYFIERLKLDFKFNL